MGNPGAGAAPADLVESDPDNLGHSVEGDIADMH
jgi:hypothetical protein